MKNNPPKSIPRIPSRAKHKNTLEWKIPGEVSVALMLIERIGYTFVAKVKIEKKHWWNRSYKVFTISKPNIADAIIRGDEFLRKHGYYIDSKSIEIGEKIGNIFN